MRRHRATAGPGTAWARYEPTAEAPWDLRRVVHLHRRAGFAGNWAEIQRDLKDGPEASINRILTGSSRTGVPDGFESKANLLADAAVASADINRLRAWWIFRMLASPDPLGERLTLMWHDHFATAQSKVEDLALMRRQNDTFRRLARAPFGALLERRVREPALLLYLDAPSNRKDHPNENLARELMELFTLASATSPRPTSRRPPGPSPAGRSTTVRSARPRLSTTMAKKPFLDVTGAGAAADLLSILLDRPSTPRTFARRLCGFSWANGPSTKRPRWPWRRVRGPPAGNRPRSRDGPPLQGVLCLRQTFARG